MDIKDVILENESLKEKVQRLEQEVDRLTHMKNGLKLNNSQLTLQRNELIDENNHLKKELSEIKSMGMFEFANKYCNNDQLEEAGHQLAKDLLGD